MVHLHPAGGDQIGGLAPGQGEPRRQHRVQPGGGHRVPDDLYLRRADLQPGQGDLPELQPGPAGALPLGQEDGDDLRQGQHLALSRQDQDVPQLLPVQTQGHEPAQDVPVGQLHLPGKDGLHRPHGAIRVGGKVLWLLPVGQKGAHRAFRSLIAPPEQAFGPAPGIQQPLGRRPLPRGEKGRVGGHIPGAGQLPLVQHPAQKDPLLPVTGAAVQQFSFGHDLPSPVNIMEQSVFAERVLRCSPSRRRRAQNGSGVSV